MAEQLQNMELKPWHRQKVSPQMQLMCALSASGLKVPAIATFLKCSEATVSTWFSDPRAQLLRSQYAGDIARNVMARTSALIEAHAEESVLTIVQIMRTGDKDSTRLAAAIELKNTAGFKPVERKLIGEMQIPTTVEDAADMRRALDELGVELEVYEAVDDSAEAFGLADPDAVK